MESIRDDSKDNIDIDMQAGINFEVLRKGANSTISVVRMAFYPLHGLLLIYHFVYA